MRCFRDFRGRSFFEVGLGRMRRSQLCFPRNWELQANSKCAVRNVVSHAIRNRKGFGGAPFATLFPMQFEIGGDRFGSAPWPLRALSSRPKRFGGVPQNLAPFSKRPKRFGDAAQHLAIAPSGLVAVHFLFILTPNGGSQSGQILGHAAWHPF